MKKLFIKLIGIIKPYLTRELLYLTFAVASIMIYKYLSFDPSVHTFVRESIFGIKTTNQMELDYWMYMIWFTSSFIYLFVIPFLSGLLLEGKNVFKKLGLTFGNYKVGLPLLAGAFVLMAIAITVAVKVFPDFKLYYPFAKHAVSSVSLFFFFELAYFSYFLGWEFFSHSFVLFPYEEKFGKGAILLYILPFVLMHHGKPIPEVIGSFVAGVFLAVLALETRSFWYGMLLHGFVAIFMDIAVTYF
ncbi:MAG: hypothetical protein A2Y33_09145 [Spirochaetes bacterium GWF1_51_8]|nr:MAG: hypothetical protein A2Y33_09145 [Spirochaetes bacterium GWF1_51_8]